VITAFSNLDPGTLTAIGSGLGAAAAGFAGKFFGARGARKSIEAEAVEKIAGSYGEALDDLRAQLRDSRLDRAEMHVKLELLEASQRAELLERKTLTDRFAELLEHVRVLRTILRANKIEYPIGPDFLNNGD
jgi:hypothetical protein